MTDGMEDLKLTVNEDFAKKLHRQKERVELDQCKYCKAFREGLKIRIMLPVHVIIGSICVCALTKIFIRSIFMFFFFTCFTKLTYMHPA